MDFVLEGGVVGTAGVDPEDDGEFFLHDCPEGLELCRGQLELEFVVGSKQGVILGDGRG